MHLVESIGGAARVLQYLGLVLTYYTFKQGELHVTFLSGMMEVLVEWYLPCLGT